MPLARRVGNIKHKRSSCPPSISYNNGGSKRVLFGRRGPSRAAAGRQSQGVRGGLGKRSHRTISSAICIRPGGPHVARIGHVIGSDKGRCGRCQEAPGALRSRGRLHERGTSESVTAPSCDQRAAQAHQPCRRILTYIGHPQALEPHAARPLRHIFILQRTRNCRRQLSMGPLSFSVLAPLQRHSHGALRFGCRKCVPPACPPAPCRPSAAIP
jgi:hypothetical protein